ncbi:MAG: 3-dehydroquinate synthase [Phycisphaerales bacterium]|nr:3-dehydroquinate synthase [Phycisphaerales bacterium]
MPDKRHESNVRITVLLSRQPYDVVVGVEALVELSLRLQQLSDVSRIAVVTDDRVNALHGPTLREAVGHAARFNVVEQGEASKSAASVGRLYDAFAEIGLGRRDLVITFGGGMVSDLGGFAAGTWMRGVPVIHVPTTLEGAIDAAIGGKTAINHAVGKNLIGVFHQPIGVYMNPAFLRTLSDRDYRAGLAESVKHGMIRDAALFEWQEGAVDDILARKEATLTELIRANCATKAHYVATDERESGPRALLNFGHTIGHAIESHSGFDLRHGECVALGMIAENRIAVNRHALSEESARRCRELLSAFGLPLRLAKPISFDEMKRAIQFDKKAVGGRARFAIAHEIGHAMVVSNVQDEELEAALTEIAPE